MYVFWSTNKRCLVRKVKVKFSLLKACGFMLDCVQVWALKENFANKTYFNAKTWPLAFRLGKFGENRGGEKTGEKRKRRNGEREKRKRGKEKEKRRKRRKD